MTASRGLAWASQEALSLAEAKLALEPQGRFILGIAGPSGSGKSTLAESLAAAVNRGRPGFSQALPVDGFHLSNAELDANGWRLRKGAPHTFDAEGFAAALARVKEAPRKEVPWPTYDRHVLHEPVPGGLTVAPATGLAVVEGNYLLLQEGAWKGVRGLLDACWYLEADGEKLAERLLARHLAGGKGETLARKMVHGNDVVNDAVIETTKHLADKTFPPGFFDALPGSKATTGMSI